MNAANVFLAGGSPKPEKPASDVLDTSQGVSVYHPGYNPHPLLLFLVAFLAPSGSCGVPLSVVLDACRILANNRDGTLRVMDDATDLIPPDDEAILLSPGHYTYHVTGGEAAYAVCTSFHAWTPPKVLPPHWGLDVMGTIAVFQAASASEYSMAVKRDDGRCAVTGTAAVCRAATWYRRRRKHGGMSGITGNPQGINSLPNCLAMRADLSGQGMDKGHFVFAPRGQSHGMPDFAAEYHLRAVKIPDRINPMNVYVRFAWGLFRALPNVLRELARRLDVVIVAEPTFPTASERTPAMKCSRPEGKSAPRGTQERNADGGTEKQEQDDEAPMLTDDYGNHQESSDDAALECPLQRHTLTERDLEAAEGLDADLNGRPLARYEEAAGIYPGFSKTLRLKQEYRKLHPEVSAVGSARVASVWEEDDEQRL
ncbi:hypothetical protein C8F04DRAFT_1201648 [Mycena alexandri]|uniref:HNH nuclease domain-containing protein n=1 Tax=Mycena alexandri TaxID=1745969 RepID=A0AAD6RWP2_9AGAR|nr:hypothetical protein C8F04DRAFT_1201648 [Mycena alexandri]